MIRRLVEGWRRLNGAVARSEAHLARLVELLEVSEAHTAALASQVELHMARLRLMDVHLGRMERQMALSDPRFASALRLERFGHKVFSQNDEDGILAEIFRRIGETSRVFVEIAAGDGQENCTAFLLRQGWRGLWVECDDVRVSAIRTNFSDEIASGRLVVADQRVTVDTVNNVIESANLEEEIDLLVMDIDGNDYHVLEALSASPRVICAEYLARWPPPVHWTMERDDDFVWGGLGDPRESGASLQALENLLTPRGYSLVGTSIAGINCFFVRSDLVGEKFAAPFTAANHYNPARYWYPAPAQISGIWQGAGPETL